MIRETEESIMNEIDNLIEIRYLRRTLTSHARLLNKIHEVCEVKGSIDLATLIILNQEYLT
jgi:hypothetical protein